MPLTWITAYDKFSALLAEKNKIDAILIGDSLNMTVYGEESTASLPPEILLYHAKSVKKYAPNTEIIIDIPYQIAKLINQKNRLFSPSWFKRAVGDDKRKIYRFFQKIRDLNIKNIKIEGADLSAQKLIKIAKFHNLEITGHLGLLPQTAQNFKVQGRGLNAEEKLLKEVKTLKDLGIKYLVLECIPEEIGKKITKYLEKTDLPVETNNTPLQKKIPTIGIGAGRHTSGQILVFDDIIEKFPSEIAHKAKFAKSYADFWKQGSEAIENYKKEVKNKKYPNIIHIYH